jgi:hypothetical protein
MPAPDHIGSHQPGSPAGVRNGSGLVAGRSLLDSIEIRFRLAAEGPSPLAVDGRRLGHGLPRRRIPLPELAAILMHPSTSYAASDEAWRLLVTHARGPQPAEQHKRPGSLLRPHGEPTWVVGAVGVAMPGLRRAASRLSRTFTGDVQAEVLIGFLDALATIDPRPARVVQRLCTMAGSRARKALRANEPARVHVAYGAPGSALPPAPFGHPDFVLARAVARGVITAAEADLIGVVYLEHVTVAEYAQRTGQTRAAVYKARERARDRLVAAIEAGTLSDPVADVVAEATLTTSPTDTKPADQQLSGRLSNLAPESASLSAGLSHADRTR